VTRLGEEYRNLRHRRAPVTVYLVLFNNTRGPPGTWPPDHAPNKLSENTLIISGALVWIMQGRHAGGLGKDNRAVPGAAFKRKKEKKRKEKGAMQEA
jgi:hypothetical protein